MKIFVTGATGFVGTHLAKRLAQTDHDMRCLVRETSVCDCLNELGAACFVGDVINRDSVRAGMQGCNWVVHLANLYSFWEPDRQAYTHVNVEGTRNVLECALALDVAKVVHVSSAVVYGKPVDCPFTEDSTFGPERFSEYAETKFLGDQLAWELYEDKGLPLVMIYPGGILGEGDDKPSGDYIHRMATGRFPTTVLHDSSITWVHVKDVVEVIVRALEKENNIGEKYLVGKYALTFKQLNDLINDMSGTPLPKIHLPDSLVRVNAALLTSLASLTHQPPPWGMSRDQVRTMKEGLLFDGSKVERKLGITYTPIRTAVKEAIESY